MATLIDRSLQGRRWPATLVLGVALVAGAELFLVIDVIARGGVIVPDESLPAPQGWLEVLARAVARNMTAIVWSGFLLAGDGLLQLFGGSPVRARPRRFALCWLASIPIWLFFDWINFTFMHAWDYHGLPQNLAHRWVGFALAFGAIGPAMLLVSEAVLRLGTGEVRWRSLRFPAPVHIGFAMVGALFVLFPIMVAQPIGNATLWLGIALLLDPVNHRLGAPSLLGDWAAGRYGRMLALMAGGLVCGLLWEFWNYWAVAKWTYNLPFLGPLEHIRYFEMPVLGLGGFLPFALEYWVAFQTVVWLARRVGWTRLEPLPMHGVL